MIVKSGIVEVKSKDPFMRSFLVPKSKKQNCRINVYSNNKNDFYTVVIQKGKRNQVTRGLAEQDVIKLLKNKSGSKNVPCGTKK